MSPVALGGWITPAERPVLAAVAGQLAECLADPGEPPFPVSFDPAPRNSTPILIVTLRGAIESDAPVAAVRAQLADRCAAALAGGCAALLLCTALRVVADRTARPVLGPRIRALNLMAVELSHALGLTVADVDRTLSLFGAGPLRTDYRLGGPVAAEMAAHAIVAALLGGGLDGIVASDRQQRAIERHGDIRTMSKVVDRRLMERAGKG